MADKKFSNFPGEKEEMIQYLVKSGNDSQKVMELYSTWAKDYDQDLSSLCSYNCPQHVVQLVADLCPDIGDVIVLDLAAGTGLVGQQLHDRGFKVIDALDGSPEMLKKAEEKKIYRKLLCHMAGKERFNVEDESYDVICTTGSFVPGHLDHTCFPEIIRTLKPGGHFVLMMAKNYLTDCPEFRDVLETQMSDYAAQGRWELVSKKTIPKYHDDVPGVSFVLRKLH